MINIRQIHWVQNNHLYIGSTLQLSYLFFNFYLLLLFKSWLLLLLFPVNACLYVIFIKRPTSTILHTFSTIIIRERIRMDKHLQINTTFIKWATVL